MERKEALGPAETILQTLLSYSDHMVHNRPGMIVRDEKSTVGVRWQAVTHKVEGDDKVVYQLVRRGRASSRVRVGVLRSDGSITEAGRVVGHYRAAGLFSEVASWMYGQVAEVWKMDNEFAARWASYAYAQDHRDLKVVLAAFMLVQSRKGDPVREGQEVLFLDEDFRDVGEAMMLLYRKDGKDLNPKLLLRVYDLLSLPRVAELNHELGFARSARRPFYGRWDKAVDKWLRYREENTRLLEGLVKAGFRTTVMELARRARYKPRSAQFFDLLRWKQVQTSVGHRTVAIGIEVRKAETWSGLSETQICERIIAEKPSYKRIVGQLPKEIGLTRAIVAAAIESGALSHKDLVILTPTIEELGLLEVPEIREKWTLATMAAEDLRAAHIAKRVRSKATAAVLETAADGALQAQVGEVARQIRVYFMVDISGSMQNAIDEAMRHVARFLHAFPLERLHVSVFSTQGREISIKHPSTAGVAQAFRGIQAGGGTDYGQGVRAIAKYKPKDDEDALFIFVGDEAAPTFERAVQESGLQPMAFGLVRMDTGWSAESDAVRKTAAHLGIPCVLIDERTFEDPYSIPRTIRHLVASTPVGKVKSGSVRVSLVDQILNTDILKKPAWAA